MDLGVAFFAKSSPPMVVPMPPLPSLPCSQEHADLVTALAVGPDGDTVASADCRGGSPQVVLWSAGTAAAAAGAASAAGAGGCRSLGCLGAGTWADGCPPLSLDLSPDGARLLAVARAGPAGGGAAGDGAVSYLVTVHDVADGSLCFALTTALYGAVHEARWCATLSKAAFAARGGISADLRGGSFALATAKVCADGGGEGGGGGLKKRGRPPTHRHTREHRHTQTQTQTQKKGGGAVGNRFLRPHGDKGVGDTRVRTRAAAWGGIWLFRCNRRAFFGLLLFLPFFFGNFFLEKGRGLQKG